MTETPVQCWVTFFLTRTLVQCWVNFFLTGTLVQCWVNFFLTERLVHCWVNFFLVLVQALSPALEQWRKRISKIATNFEANKAATSGTAGKQLTKASQPPQAEVTSQAL